MKRIINLLLVVLILSSVLSQRIVLAEDEDDVQEKIEKETTEVLEDSDQEETDTYFTEKVDENDLVHTGNHVSEELHNTESKEVLATGPCGKKATYIIYDDYSALILA